jgi:hypothetical protein
LLVLYLSTFEHTNKVLVLGTFKHFLTNMVLILYDFYKKILTNMVLVLGTFLRVLIPEASLHTRPTLVVVYEFYQRYFCIGAWRLQRYSVIALVCHGLFMEWINVWCFFVQYFTLGAKYVHANYMLRPLFSSFYSQ